MAKTVVAKGKAVPKVGGRVAKKAKSPAPVDENAKNGSQPAKLSERERVLKIIGWGKMVECARLRRSYYCDDTVKERPASVSPVKNKDKPGMPPPSYGFFSPTPAITDDAQSNESLVIRPQVLDVEFNRCPVVPVKDSWVSYEPGKP